MLPALGLLVATIRGLGGLMMRGNRRDFLKIGAAIAAGAALPLRARANESFISLWEYDFSVLQLATDEETAQFRILRHTDRDISYRFLDSKGRELAWRVLDSFTHSSRLKDRFDHLIVTGLSVGHDYRLQIIDNALGKVADERIFSALDTKKANGRFAILSCMHDSHDFAAGRSLMWKALADTQPDILFLIGDACYADEWSNQTEPSIWNRFVETRRNLDLYYWKRLIPVLAVWDDHDFGVNNGDTSFKLKHACKQFFEACFGWSERPAYVRGPGLASYAALFGQKFLLMDDRFFRSPRSASAQTHWGEVQEEWLFDRLGKEKNPAWIFNGNQFFGGYHKYESFERLHKTQFNRVMKRFANLEAPVAFGTGDVHFSEIMRIEPEILGYETFEFVSSSMHSFPFDVKGGIPANARRIQSTLEYNFTLFDSQVIDGAAHVNARSVGQRLAVNFTHDFVLKR